MKLVKYEESRTPFTDIKSHELMLKVQESCARSFRLYSVFILSSSIFVHSLAVVLVVKYPQLTNFTCILFTPQE